MRRFVPFLCVFAYFASPYRLLGFELPELLCLFAVFIQIILLSRSAFKVYLPKEYWAFVAYMWVVPPIISVIVGHPCSIMDSLVPVALILTTIYLAVLVPNVNVALVIRYYRRLVYVAIVFFIVQEFCVGLLGFRPTLYFSFLESYYEGANMMDFSESRSEMARSASFFLEPSHFIQYIIPYVCIVASHAVRSKIITKELVFLVIVVLWAKSGVGYLEMLVIFLFLFLFSWKKSIFIKIFVAGVIVILSAFVVTNFADNPLVANVLERTNEFSLEIEHSSAQSGFIRIWRGYFIYLAGDILNILFGTANAAIEYVSLNVYIPGVRYEGSYLNGIQSLLVAGGVVGTLLFFSYIKKIYSSFTMTGRCVIVSMICCFFLEHMLFTPKMFLYILISYSISKYENYYLKV